MEFAGELDRRRERSREVRTFGLNMKTWQRYYLSGKRQREGQVEKGVQIKRR